MKYVLNDLGLDHDVIFHDAEEIMNYENPGSYGRKLVWTDKENMVETGNLTGPEATVRAIPADFFTKYHRYRGIR